MTEEELREMFAALEAQGVQPMLCDTPVAVYDGRVNAELWRDCEYGELYDWMSRSKANYNSYIDNRRHYLTELFNYINSLGFKI